ncbi:hypothetical protein [Phenylobacterium sp. J367]|uniref:hypothetical protein n=1 Tax=Phenylobacterium sp. J367 TaxID=2898435 RepID=UPI0021512DA3|nr:hypothetical protein [Phenylobacterium sp. J367]MCR5880342.1 hypothetical protein [Phenylobacterium sp. J367]
MGLPIVAEGRLVNYVFVYVRINLTGSANTAQWRAREPFFRDALVRAGHRTPFTLKGDYQKIDTARLTAALTREAQRIAGPGVIQSVAVTSQAPRGRATAPRPPAARRPPRLTPVADPRFASRCAPDYSLAVSRRLFRSAA